MQRSRVGSLIAAGVIAVGTMMTLTAPTATAMPRADSLIRNSCKANGGSFWSYTADGEIGLTGYICQFVYQGVTYRDVYNSQAQLDMTCEWTGRKYRNCNG